MSQPLLGGMSHPKLVYALRLSHLSFQSPRIELIDTVPSTWLPTWDVIFLEDGKVLLSDPFDVIQGDVVDLTADAFHRVLGRGRDMGATLFAQMF